MLRGFWYGFCWFVCFLADVVFCLFIVCLGYYLLVLAHVQLQSVLVVGEKVALAADALVVHLVDVRGQTLRPRRFVVAQYAQVRFDVRVQVPLQTPVVDAPPRAVRARVQLFLLLLLGAALAAAAASSSSSARRCRC